MRILLLGTILCTVLALLAPPSAATPALRVWYFDDSGVAGWGQTYAAPMWEWADAGPLNGTLPYYDLDPNNPYHACTTPLETADLSGCYMWAEIYLANNWPNPGVNGVTVELWEGNWLQTVRLLATANGTVTNQFPGQIHMFNFGQIQNANLVNSGFVVKIIYSGAAGDTHIYWDQPAYPSALYASNTTPVTPATWGAIKELFSKKVT